MNNELERLAAACLFPSFAGPAAPEWVCRWVQQGLGGIVLFSSNVETPQQLAGLTAALKAEREEILIAVDEEGGDVTRLESATGSSYPGNYALGAVDDPELTAAVGAAIAGELSAVGINLDLAPVADVNTNPDNPVIGTRSFGADAELVARHTAAFVDGLQSGGVAACAKHFPGHGDTELDSHLALPTVDADRESLLGGALVPFRAAIEAGVQAVMTAHIVVPAVDRVPATISRELLEGLLRSELGFHGLVITDALDMAAISRGVGAEEGAIRALEAGADALCLGPTIGEARVAGVHHAIVEAARRGRLADDRLSEAARRVAGTAEWTAQAASPSPARREVGLEAARRALLVEGDVGLAEPPLLVELEGAPSIASDPPAGSLADLLGAERLPLSRGDAAPDVAGRFVVAVVRDAHRHAWQREIVDALGGDIVVVETGLPHWRPARAAGYIATRGSGRVNLEAAAELLLARAPAAGSR
jgi:beta-N-acetylhexosaminidase